jgi:ATP-dependent protease HslVU (ClpYQ) ATPase subunit
MESVLHDLMFEAPSKAGTRVRVDQAYVTEALKAKEDKPPASAEPKQ